MGKLRQGGFTLIELMITLVIVGLLAAVALPSYRSYIQKGNRSAAQAQMLDIADREQQFLMTRRQYADKATLESSGYQLPSSLSSLYTYSVATATATVPAFTITFTPISGSAQANEVELTLNSDGVKAPTGKW